ncbi:MAG: hypothetical protein B7Z06_12005, partial [Flavobacteriales bacterium 32-35-8]
MGELYSRKTNSYTFYYFMLIIALMITNGITAQTVTSPQVNFTQRTAAATPAKTIYNIKGDFTMLGNTNLTLVNYGNTTNNESNSMQYVDIDGDSNTWNSSMATMELSNGGENSAIQNCSTVIYAGLYWTGKSQDADTFTASKQVQNGTQSTNTTSTITNGQQINNTTYTLNITKGGTGNSRYPIYTFTGNGNTYVFTYTNSATVTVSVNGATATNVPLSTITTTSGIATAPLASPYYIIADGTVNLTIYNFKRSTSTDSNVDYTGNSSVSVNVTGTIPTYTTVNKNYDKKVISLKGPGASSYTAVTANSDVYFPGSAYSGIFVGYQEVTEYVKAHGPGAYTVADIALIEGNNSNPGYSGGWVMVVIYENPAMKSRAVTLFDGYAYVNGQRSGGGEFGNIPISGFTTVDSGPVNMKLGVMAAEGDIATNSGSDYL